MSIKSLSKIIGFSLFFISIMAVTAFGAEYSVNGQKYEFENPIINENGVSYISIYDYVNITDKKIKYESEDSVAIDYPKGYFIVGDSRLHFKDGTSIKFYNATIRYNNIMYVPLRMPKEIDSIIIMYDTKTGNTDIYNAYDLYGCVQKFKLNDYEAKACRLVNLEKYISNVYRNFDAEAAQIDKSGYENGENGSGKIVYTAKNFPERTITVYFENGYIKQIEDTNGAEYVIPDAVTETTADYVNATCGDFSVTIYAKDEYSELDDDSIYAEVKYIGDQECYYAWGASPCFAIGLSGFGGVGIDDVAIRYKWEKGEVKTYPLKLYSHRPEKDGEYEVYGRLELTDDQNGKPIKISLSKNIILK